MMRNFEKIITKKKRRGYDEHVELVKSNARSATKTRSAGKNLMRFFAMEETKCNCHHLTKKAKRLPKLHVTFESLPT
ncbi:hypothetical protein SIP_065 [Escherichia phage vB_Eco_Sip]|uniref:Uncharacterized protein n=1 Tax=Escherichia phage vB_Eco_Sip TaxID=2831640 RepID=A0AAD1V5N0_9CAUD|nr:hypothetical protein SIP_065 [Escherichia phage vB_Eco_Sip]